MSCNVYPEVWMILHELTAPDHGLNGRGYSGLHVWLKDRKNEVGKLRDARTDEDESHQKASDWNTPEMSQRG